MRGKPERKCETPSAAAETYSSNRSICICRAIDVSRSPSPDPAAQNAPIRIDATPMLASKIDLRRTFAWAAVLVVCDAFIFNQGAIAALVGLWTLVVALPRAVFFAKDPEQRRSRLAQGAILLGAALVVLACNAANNHIARSRADTLIAAIEAFDQKHQRFPSSLDELVPDFIDHVPAAKWILNPGFGRFYYFARADRHWLMYMAMPPLGRPFYHCEKAQWGYVD